MSESKKFKKDYYGGALMMIVGVASVSGGVSYNIGALSHMGPGYFPAALGALLAITGLLIAIMARFGSPNAEEEVPVGQHSKIPDLRGGVCIILSVLAFILFGKYGGLLPATFIAVVVAALGDRDNSLLQSILLAVGMSVVAIVVFWWALQLQLPLFQWG